MIVQQMASNLQQRLDRAGQTYHDVRQVWRDTQQQAWAIVSHNGRSVAHTEIGAAKNIFTSAQAAFRRAQRDGLRQVTQRPGRYVPAGRKQTRAAYRATLKLLDRTRSDLGDVVGDGYAQMTARLGGAAPADGVEARSVAGRATRARKKQPSRRATRKPKSTAN